MSNSWPGEVDKIIGPVLKARTVCGGCLHFVKEAFFNTLCFPLELLLDLYVKNKYLFFGILLLESPCSFFRLSLGDVFFENVKFMLNVRL